MLADRLVGLASSKDIAEAISDAVRNGELTQGAALPSIRELATDVGVSPGTISMAYRQLRERGVITTAHGRKSRVADLPALPRPTRFPLPQGVRDVSTASPDPRLLPDLGRWMTPELYSPVLYDSAPMDPELVALMTEQFQQDGVVGELSLTHGALDAMERILTGRLRRGDAVLVEDPQWVSSSALLRILGLDVVPVAVDDEGLVPQELRAALASRHCSALILTPRAQNPYGSALTPSRGEQLRAVLAEHPALLVVEDDHASLIAGAPATTLTTGRSSYAVIRSMSKALGPDLRLAMVASDAETADRVQGRMLLGPGWVSHIVQRLVAAVLTDDEALRAVAAAEATYTARRRGLIAELARHGIRGVGASGLNVLVPVHEETSLTAHLLARGWAVRSGESFRLRSAPFIRVCAATMTEPDSRELAGVLAELLASAGRARGG